MGRVTDIVALSADYLTAVKCGEDRDTIRASIAELDESSLRAVAASPATSKAFWITLYNAVVQDTLKRDTSAYEQRRRFFRNDRVTVSGTHRSLDAIEHRILRSSTWKYGLGYLPRPFPGRFERTFRLERIDPRIHFALTCGAKSCPPIVAYAASNIEDTLDLNTRTFLEQSSDDDRSAGERTVSRLFLFYRGDFRGRRSIYEFLERYGIIETSDPPGSLPHLRLDAYRGDVWRGPRMSANTDEMLLPQRNLARLPLRGVYQPPGKPGRGSITAIRRYPVIPAALLADVLTRPWDTPNIYPIPA